MEKKKFKLPKITTRDVAYILTILFMLGSLAFTRDASYTIFAGRDSTGKAWWGWIGDRALDLTLGPVETVVKVFVWNGVAAIYAVILYTLVLIRNKNTLYQFNENHIDIRNAIIHFLNIIFLTSVFAAFVESGSVFGIPTGIYIFIAIIFTATSMKTLSGYAWILATFGIINNLNSFGRWGINGAFYIILSYISIAIQILVLKIFEFDLNELKNDFSGTQRTISDNVHHSVETTKSGAKVATKAVVSAAAIATTGVPVDGIINENNAKDK